MFDNRRLTIDLCLPVYNEEAILADNVQRIVDFINNNDLSVDCRIIILVNGSSDRSAVIAKELSERWPGLIDFRDYKVASRGLALLAYADSSQADWWGYMDIDLAVSLVDLSKMFKPIIKQTADLVIASRLVTGNFCSRSWLREVISRVYNQLARLFLGTTVRDHQCGCKFINQLWWQTLRPQLQDSHWFLDTEIIAWTTKLGGQITEVPVDWVDNRYQLRPTKVKLLRDIINFLANLYHLRRRLKVK